MSVEVTNRVWSHSTRKGSDLVLMLALANRADEDGICWPGLQYLADKARVVERQARRMLRQLEAAHEIFTLTGRGRGRTTYYFVTVGLTREQVEHVLVTRLRMKPLEVAAALERWLGAAGIKGDADVRFKKGDVPGQKGDVGDIKPDIPGRKGDVAMSPDTKEETKEKRRKTHTRPHGLGPPISRPAAPAVGVCAKSRFSFEERLSYARNRPHVKNPEGFAASKRAAEGEFDEAISAWLAEQESPSLFKRELDVSGCPDCFGTGMYYPDGLDKGVAKCRHPRLEEAAVEAVPP